MYNDYYRDHLEELSKQTVKENETLCMWLKQVLFLATTLFGILISLPKTIPESLYARLCFFLAVALLCLGILALLWALYHFSTDTARKVREAYQNELMSAQKENRHLRPVGYRIAKSVLFCEKAGYVCIGLSFLLLSVYSAFVYLIN
jgi:hypothetical protein